MTLASAHHVTPSAVRAKPVRIGEILLDQGLIREDQLAQALEVQKSRAGGKLLGQILVDQGFVSQEQLTRTLASSLGVPFAVITQSMVHPEAIKALPRPFLERHNLLPLSVVEGWLTVAVEDFANVFLVEEIKRISGCEVQILAATPENLRTLRQALVGEDQAKEAETAGGGEALGAILEQIGEDSLTVLETQHDEDDADLADIQNAASDSPVIKLVNYMIQSAITEKASDIHLEPGEGSFRVRFRVDGELFEAIKPPQRLLAAVVSRIKIMAGMDIAERRVPQDGGMTVLAGQRPVDLRVSTMPTKHGEKVVMRLIDSRAGLMDLDSLGFSPHLIEPFRAVIREPNGVILVTGPTGSGKSTTLYAALGEIANDRSNICTVEDPVEFNLAGLNQFQINTKAGFTFARALRALLRQDPDIIMLGEIRDVETAKLAAEAALTGHLVLSTLHTNDAPSAVTRLVNMGVEPFLVAASLRAVLAQRLVRRICPHCRQEVPVSGAVRAVLERCRGSQPPLEKAFVGAGCSRCRGSGAKGRVAIHELLLVDEVMLEGIGRGMGLQEIRRHAQKNGFTTLLQDGLAKAREGLITIESVLEAASRTTDTPEAPEAPAAPQAPAADGEGGIA